MKYFKFKITHAKNEGRVLVNFGIEIIFVLKRFPLIYVIKLSHFSYGLGQHDYGVGV